MDTLYTFWDNITHDNTKSVHLGGLMNSATKGVCVCVCVRGCVCVWCVVCGVWCVVCGWCVCVV